MNELGKPVRKYPSKKLKNSKNQTEIAAREQKTTSEKANFSNTVFTPQNHSLLRATSCFGIRRSAV